MIAAYLKPVMCEVKFSDEGEGGYFQIIKKIRVVLHDFLQILTNSAAISES